MYNIAVVLAAGNGTRMGIDKSKLLIDIGGKTVIERSVAVFENMAEIDEIIVVCRECDVETFSKLLPQENITFVIGGETRQQSVKNAVETIDDCDYIIIHDGARPLVTPETVVKTHCDIARKLQMLFLVYSDGNKVGLIKQYVGCHQNGIIHKSHIDIILMF